MKPHNYGYQDHLYGFPCANCIPETIPYIDYDHLNKWAAEQEKRKGRTWTPISPRTTAQAQ